MLCSCSQFAAYLSGWISFLNPAVIRMVDQVKARPESQSLYVLNGGTPIFEEQTPVWVWDGYWWPAYVVVPALDLGSDLMLVRFGNGVTAPVKASDVRHCDSESTHINQLGHAYLLRIA